MEETRLLALEELFEKRDYRALRAAFADQEASRKSWYPTLSLTGSLGSNSLDLVDLLANPAASLGAGLALPFIQWNEMQTALKISEAVARVGHTPRRLTADPARDTGHGATHQRTARLC